MLPKRDAHAQNWIIDARGRILAADLDCVGMRPLGYELAQLTDDFPFLAVSDNESRTRIISAYTSELISRGMNVDERGVTVGYELGLFARSAFILTHTESTAAQRSHAVELLRSLRSGAAEARVREVATATYSVWALANNVKETSRTSAAVRGDRSRLSRAMSFQLRHNPNAPTSRDGWIYVDSLVDLLRTTGFETGRDQILAVAGALGDARFETKGDRIRARHGHSKDITVDYVDEARPSFLFHGTSIANLTSIIEARDGLRPMSRKRVHLTERPAIALHAAARRKEPVILMRLSSADLEDAGRATEDIWVTPRVPASLLQVVPVWEMFELLKGRVMETL